MAYSLKSLIIQSHANNSNWLLEHYNKISTSFTQSYGLRSLWESYHGCALDKSAATVWSYHVSMDRNLSAIISFLNLRHKEIRLFWRGQGLQPGTTEVYQAKWLNCLCIISSTRFTFSLEVWWKEYDGTICVYCSNSLWHQLFKLRSSHFVVLSWWNRFGGSAGK